VSGTARAAAPARDVPVWLQRVLVAATVVLLTAIRWQFVGIPMERDEGAYALSGERLIQGLRPYVDFYDHRPPAFFLTYGGMVRLLGYDYMNLQRGFCIVFAITLLCSYGFLRRLTRTRAALAVLPVYGLALLNSQICGFTIQSEFVVLLFASLGLWLLSAGMARSETWMVFIAGASLGWAALVKEVGVFYCLCAALWIGTAVLEDARSARIGRLFGAYVAGGALAIATALAWVLARGVSREAAFWVVEFPRRYYLGLVPLTTGLPLLRASVLAIVREQPTFWAIGALGLVLGFFRSVGAATTARCYVLVLCATATVVPGFLFMRHYFILLMPALATALAMAYGWLLERTSPIRHTAFAAALALVPASNFVASYGHYVHPDFAGVLHATYGSNPFPEMKVVGDYLNTRLRAGDEIFVAGSEPELYLYTKTTGITRHSFIEFLSLPSPFATTWQQEAIDDVERARPRFIVNVNHPYSWAFNEGSVTLLHDWLFGYLQQHYRFVYVADQVEPGQRSVYTAFADAPGYRLQGRSSVDVWERNQP
jgi:hypothetical protein